MNSKVLIAVLAALFLAGVAVFLFRGASVEQSAVVTESPAVEEQVAGETPAPEDATEAANETLEVVEESAAEAEPEAEAIVLAQAEPVEAPQEWQFSEGKHYTRMVPTQPTVGGADKVEVAEFFWYGCPHCMTFEPYLNEWATEIPANARLVKIPIVWNQVALLHGRLFYTAEVLIRNGIIENGNAFHDAVFNEYQNRGNRMTSENAIRDVFKRFNVTDEDFDKTWNSFEVDQKLRVANDLMRRYKIDAVPAVVVNGKYKTSAGEAGTYPQLIDLIDELILRESLR